MSSLTFAKYMDEVVLVCTINCTFPPACAICDMKTYCISLLSVAMRSTSCFKYTHNLELMKIFRNIHFNQFPQKSMDKII